MLTFDPKAHAYFWDGRPVPSVTQILDIVPLDFHCAPGVLAAAMERGQHVHMATAYHDEGTLDEASVRDEIRPYLTAWIKFRQDTGYQPTLTEKQGCNSRYGYAGTVDSVGTVGGRIWLLDRKSGIVPARSALQTAAYAELDEIKTYPKPERYCVRLMPDGTYSMSEQYKSAQDFAVFLAFLKVYNFTKQGG
jgi:hypothetical protein